MEALDRDANSVYAPMPNARVYRIVFEEVDETKARSDISIRNRAAALEKTRQAVAKLTPEDIEYIKKNL